MKKKTVCKFIFLSIIFYFSFNQIVFLFFQRKTKTDKNKLRNSSANQSPEEKNAPLFEDNVSLLTNEFEQ